MKKQIVALFALTLLLSTAAEAQKNQIEKTWYNQEKTSKIRVFKTTDGSFAGKIVWLDEPNDKETGKPRTDKENPDEAKKSTPLIDLVILRGYKPSEEDPNVYVGGKIYDPKNGKTYCGKITFKGNTLDLRGFLCNATFLGRTSTWSLAE